MIVLDIETSGNDLRKHSIVGISALDFSNPTNIFYGQCTVWPGAEIQPEFLEARGISPKSINNTYERKPFGSLINNYLFWTKSIEDKMPAGYDISTKVAFLKESLKKTNHEGSISKTIPINILDLHTLAYDKFFRLGMNIPTTLEQILQLVGLESKKIPNDLQEGVILEAEAINRLMKGKPLFKKYENPKFQMPDYLEQQHR